MKEFIKKYNLKTKFTNKTFIIGFFTLILALVSKLFEIEIPQKVFEIMGIIITILITLGLVKTEKTDIEDIKKIETEVKEEIDNTKN